MSPLFCQLPNTKSSNIFSIEVSRSDRWRISRRLQELTIHCSCPDNGSVEVEVRDGIAALLVRSVVQQFLAPRNELIDWLERCWNSD